MIATILLPSLIALASGQNQVEWSYEDLIGPYFWPFYLDNCGGERQSPIDIDCDYVERANLQCFDFKDYHKKIDSAKIVNDDGKTIEVIPNESIRISGGGLPGNYRLEQFHFHWGIDNYEGSEHTFDFVQFPMEAHFVHRNEKYATTEEAVQHKDGLAVIAVLFKLCHSSSSAMKTITTNLNKVLYANQEANINFPSTLGNLLPESNCSYFRYNGSLTTPECHEAVIWTVFADPICITPSELAKFREVRRTAPEEVEEFLRQNFRPVQPVFGRRIQTNVECYLYK